MAASVRKATGIDPELVEGKRGEFTVWVGDQMVAGKNEHDFPSDEDVLSSVQRALGA